MMKSYRLLVHHAFSVAFYLIYLELLLTISSFDRKSSSFNFKFKSLSLNVVALSSPTSFFFHRRPMNTDSKVSSSSSTTTTTTTTSRFQPLRLSKDATPTSPLATTVHTPNNNEEHSILDEVAYSQQTPHSGRHFLPFHPYYTYQQNQQNPQQILPSPSRKSSFRKASQSIKTKRFMEGWYLRVTLPQNNTSVAFMYSIEVESGNHKNGNYKIGINEQPPLTAMQIMGPRDEYLVQADTDIAKFWAYEHCQAFGCIFDEKETSQTLSTSSHHNVDTSQSMMSLPARNTNSFLTQINSGYQVLPTKMQGRLVGHDGSMGGVMDNQGIPGTCEFDIDITPLSGWGDDDDDDDDNHDHDHANDYDNANDYNANDYDANDKFKRGEEQGQTTTRIKRRQRIKQFFQRKLNFHHHNPQKQQLESKTKAISKKQRSTAGWLASYSIFEPHWQITMADAKATGYITWKDQTYNFTNAPFYVEKNWGSTFPTKWYWVQCNAFEGCDDHGRNVQDNRLSLTAGGGIRLLSFFNGLVQKSEDVGMVGIHYNGTFYENVPWTGEMEWDIDTWGSWKFKGRCTTGKRLFEVIVNAHCDMDAGVMLRVPTKENGLDFRCRDTFEGKVSLSLYELEYSKEVQDYIRKPNTLPIIENAKSNNCAVEVGGAPWDEKWNAKSNMNKILKRLVKIPYLFQYSK